jgi:hypothetical protein|tara:strand:+ start:150 stop:500 length:351 start_codon:yes stop_codon:yes gene_type:complete
MPQTDIAPVKVKCLVVANFICADYPQILVALPDTLLPTTSGEFADRYSRRNTGFAMGTVWSIDMIAAAAKSERGQLAIQRLIDWLTRVDKKGGRFLIIEVAAAVRVGGVYLDVTQR